MPQHENGFAFIWPNPWIFAPGCLQMQKTKTKRTLSQMEPYGTLTLFYVIFSYSWRKKKNNTFLIFFFFDVLWFNLEKRIRKVKAWELIGWDKQNLLSKAKAAHKQSITRNSFTTSYWQLDDHTFPGKQGQSHIIVPWENKQHHSEHPPSPFFILSLYYWAWHHTV